MQPNNLETQNTILSIAIIAIWIIMIIGGIVIAEIIY